MVKLDRQQRPPIPHSFPRNLVGFTDSTRSAKAPESAGRREQCGHQEEGEIHGAGKKGHSSHVSGSLRSTRGRQDLERSPIWSPEAGGTIPGHRHKGSRRVEATHQAPHVQFVARERAAQPVSGGTARHGQRGSGARLRGTARDSSTGPSRRAPGCGPRPACRRGAPETGRASQPVRKNCGGRGAPSVLSDTATLTYTPEFIIRRSPR